MISNIKINNHVKGENCNLIYDQILDMNEKIIKLFLKTNTLFYVEGINGKRNTEMLFTKYLKDIKHSNNNDDDDDDDEEEDEDGENSSSDNEKDVKNKKMSISYRNNFFTYIINKFYKNSKINTTSLNKLKNIMLTNINLKNITENNSFLEKTLKNLLQHQVNSLVLITVLLQPYSIDDYVFQLKEIDEFNIKKTLNNKIKTNVKKTNDSTNKEDTSLINTVPCIKLIKKFMKDSTPYNNNSLMNLINHYYTIIDNKENAHRLLWLLFNIYYLECIYNEFKNNSSSTFETYTRLLAVKPIKKGDCYLERLKWIVKLFEEQKNTEVSLQGLINFCLYVSLKEDNSHIFFGDDSDLDFEDEMDEINNLKNKSEILF